MCRTAYKRQGLLDTTIEGMPEPFVEPHYGGCTHTNPSSSCGGDTRHYLIENDHPYRAWQPGSGDLEEIDNPGAFRRTSLDPGAGPDFVRRGSYGGANAMHSYIGAGSIVTTAEDLVRFMVSFRPIFLGETTDTTLLRADQASAMFPTGDSPTDCSAPRVAVTETGVMACYSLGWFVGNDAGDLETWSHGGDTEGTDSQLFYHPETDSVVAVLFARKVMGAGPLLGALDATLDEIATGTPPGEGNFPAPGGDDLLLGLPPLGADDEP